jgi:PTS system fructose-specific IIC component
MASSVVGSAVTGALAMAFSLGIRAPHGGIWVIALINNWLMFLIAVVVGMVICGLVVIALKGSGARKAALDSGGAQTAASVGALGASAAG